MKINIKKLGGSVAPTVEVPLDTKGLLQLDFILKNGSEITIRESADNLLSVRVKNGVAFTIPVGSNGWDIGAISPRDIEKIKGAL